MSDAGAGLFLAGRIVFSLFFVMGAGIMGHLMRGPMMVGYARQMRFPAPALASWPAGFWLVAGGLSVALGAWGDVGALMLALFVVVAAAWFHRYWEIPDEQQKMMQMQLFWRNVTFLGAALILFAIFASLGHDLRFTLTDPLFDLR